MTIAGRDGMAIPALVRSEIVSPQGAGPDAVLDLAVIPTLRNRRG